MSEYEWTCAGCGVPSPNKIRVCDCPTNVVCWGKKQEWKKRGPDRWRLVERQYCFDVMCERPGAHITIKYGDTSHNIPRFGTKEQARADAELIVEALNNRDCP